MSYIFAEASLAETNLIGGGKETLNILVPDPKENCISETVENTSPPITVAITCLSSLVPSVNRIISPAANGQYFSITILLLREGSMGENNSISKSTFL